MLILRLSMLENHASVTLSSDVKVLCISRGGRGVTTIQYMQVRDVPFFGVPFFEQKINLGYHFW